MDTQTALQTTQPRALQLADLGALVAEWLSYERTFNQAAPATVDTYAKGLQAFAAWLQENNADGGTVTASTVVTFRNATTVEAVTAPPSALFSCSQAANACSPLA